MTAFLTPTDLERLTRFKLRYQLEAAGFSRAEAEALVFLAYRLSHGLVAA